MLSLSLIFLGLNCGILFFPQDQGDTRSFLRFFFGTEVSAVPENMSSWEHGEIIRSLKKDIKPLVVTILTTKTDPVISTADLTITLTDAELDTLRRKFTTTACYYWIKNQSSIFSFTTPVFLRENSLCFFYYSVACGQLCGEGKFVVYRKINGKWEHYFTIWEWIS